MQFVILATVLVLSRAANPDARRPSPAEELAKIARKYQIEILTKDLQLPVRFLLLSKIDGKPADARDIAEFTPTFVREFSLYPPEFVKCGKIKRIVLCKDLTAGKELRGGGLTDWDHGAIYFDVSAFRGTSRSYVSRAIHHEMMHAVDYANDRKQLDDERWTALNPAGFKYGPGAAAALDDPEALVLTDRFAGFLDRYATMHIAEDKAEVFSGLVTAPDYLRRRAENDPVVRAKVKRVKELVASVCPQMGDAFWNRSAAVTRPPAEFDTETAWTKFARFLGIR